MAKNTKLTVPQIKFNNLESLKNFINFGLEYDCEDENIYQDLETLLEWYERSIET